MSLVNYFKLEVEAEVDGSMRLHLDCVGVRYQQGVVDQRQKDG